MSAIIVSTPEGVHEFVSAIPYVADSGALYILPTGKSINVAMLSPCAVYQQGHWYSVTDGVRAEAPARPDMFSEIADFMRAGGQKVPAKPEKSVPKDVDRFVDRVREEIIETTTAYFMTDKPEVVDGFLDTAYVALTGAIRVAGEKKARECWEAIMRANTSKIDGTYGPTVRDEHTGKILKPEGWTAPNIESILGRD